MTMRDSNHKLTICEVIRCINDRLQNGTYINVNEIRDMLSLTERMAKKIVGKLRDYNEQFDSGWWKDNAEYKKQFDREMQNYTTGDADKALQMLSKDNS